MIRRLTLLLLVIVVLPTGLLAWLAISGVRDERRRVAGQIRAAAESRLIDLDARIGRLLEDRSRQLLDLTSSRVRDTEGWRRLVWFSPEIAQIAVQTADGRLVHPPLGAGISDAEREFLIRIRQMLEDGMLGETDGPADAGPRRKSTPNISHGWVSWYWDTGLHLLLWRKDPGGGLIAIELDRARLVADLLVELSTASQRTDSTSGWGRIVLEDSRGRVLFLSAAAGESDALIEVVERRLSPPLAAWTIRAEIWSSPVNTLGGFLRLAGLLLVAGVLGGLAFVFHRESSRELREASERVGFVNQVSHELRTPLTNIRLYAELLERRLEGDDRETRSYIDVIVAESARLSRLIGNVLTFARHDREALTIHPVEGSVDEIIGAVTDQFRPSLEAKEIEIVLDLGAQRPVSFDPDALEQIVGNLLSNVEKYAADGKLVEITTRQTDAVTRICVADRGPGIPAAESEAVFEPFHRLSDRLTEGVSGTGIGLAIARELARLHGGELRLLEGGEGARFELELPHEIAGGSP